MEIVQKIAEHGEAVSTIRDQLQTLKEQIVNEQIHFGAELVAIAAKLHQITKSI